MNTSLQFVYQAAFLVLVILTGVMLIRAVKGPETTDRIVAVNMISTMVICIILILSQLLDEAWLLDVALIYAMISVIVVTMLASMYVKPDRAAGGAEGQAEKEGSGMWNKNRRENGRNGRRDAENGGSES